MSIDRNRRALQGYLVEHDDSFLAEDAVFTDMSSGQESRGREEIGVMINWFYHVAFDAVAEPVALIVDEEHAAFEGIVVGRHIGEFVGVPASGREFRVPLAVTYDLADGQITAGRIYFAVPALLAQIGAPA
jgi:steroid delta-isomerase-like uncharacterized protein